MFKNGHGVKRFGTPDNAIKITTSANLYLTVLLQEYEI
jgi:hypothetical protein